MNCHCWECRPKATLSDFAPRLARARDQRLVARYWQQRIKSELLHAERLLAHRELQVLRAGLSGNPKYIRHRYRKLEQAKRIVEGKRRRLKEAA